MTRCPQDFASRFQFSVVVTDPRQPDNPIVYASDAFLQLTGYTADEVLGRNCRFLQGPETERRHITEMRDAFREERPCRVCLLNYKKSGEKFWNQLYIEPIVDASGQVLRYVGIQTNVTSLFNNQTITPQNEISEGRDRVVETEKKDAQRVSQWLSVDTSVGRDEMKEREACSILPTSILVALDRIQQSFVLVDPNLPDMPIVHAAEAFLTLTGYPRDQIVGRNCRFLQGPLTDSEEVYKIHKAVHASPPQSVTATLVNYKFDGTPFWNALHISPVRGADGHVAYLVGVQMNASEVQDNSDPLSKLPLPSSDGELSHRGRHIPYCPQIGLKQRILQNGTVGEVRMAVRSLSGEGRALRRFRDDCRPPSQPNA